MRFALATMMLLWTVPMSAQRTVSVSNVEELYAAVNDPGNADTIIELAPGQYNLTPTDPAGAPRPNLGSLVLPAGATLQGQNQYVDLDGDGVWDPRDPSQPDVFADPATETIIDASRLTGLIGSSSVITLGFANGVERVTVRNNTFAGALIGVTLAPAGVSLDGFARDCLVERGQRGLRAQHRNSSFAGLASSAVFEGNISRNNLGTFGFGIQVQNVADDASWTVTLRNNRVYGNKFGLFVVGLTSTNPAEYILSQNNIYERNTTGVVLQAGRDNGAAGPQGSSGGVLRFDSLGDAIWNNAGTSMASAEAGGVDMRAGFRSASVATPSFDNQVQAQFIGVRFVQGTGSENRSGTSRRDMSVWGAIGTGGIFPGDGNVVRLLVRQSVSDASPQAFLLTDSAPAAGNEVQVLGSDVATAQTNVGIVLERNDTP